MKNPNSNPPLALLNNTVAENYSNPKEEKYRAIVENSIHAFFLTGIDGTILESNHAASIMFGYTPDEFRNLKRWDIIDHTDINLLQALEQLEKTGSAMTEATGIKKSGEHFPVEIFSKIFIDTDGVRKSSTMLSDISARKKTEAAMRLSNERFDLVVKATNDLVWDWDLVTGEIYRSGNGLADVYGHSSNEAIKNIHAWADFLHPHDKDKISQQIAYFINTKEENTFNFEYRFRREDGTYVYINDKGYIIRNEQGKAIRMIGAAEDITERKKSELAIKESELRYKMFVQQSTEGIWRIDLKEAMPISTPLDEMIEYCYHNAWVAECNDTFAKMYGFKNAEDIIGLPLNKIIPAENPSNMNYLVKFFSNGFKVEEEISYKTDKEGQPLILLNNMVGIIEGEYIKRAWGTQRNITGQKKAEQALAESENRLRTIVQTDPECIKLLNKEGEVLEMNSAGLIMVEADSVDQVLGLNVLELVLPEYRESFKNSINDVYEGKSVQFEFEIKGFKGRHLFMETHCVPLRNAQADIIAVLSVTRDITKSKNAQALLLASEERYRYLFNNNPASIIIWDIETLEITEVNETAVELYGYSREKFLQLNVTDLLHKEKKIKSIKPVQLVNQKDIQKETSTWHHLTSCGDVIIMEITSHKITYKGKNALLTLGNNITEKVQLENSLNEERQIRQQQITEAVITGQEKERTEIGEELHDNINQILASTKLYIECALKDKQPRADLINESRLLIEKAMVEIRNLSKALLPPSLGEVGLLQALCEMAENIKQVNELSISIDWHDLDENELSNKLKLTIFRIVQEQLNNVIKHAGAKQVIISVKKAQEIIQVSIKDDGCGFDTSLKRNGVGLRNITSRAEVNNGIAIIDSKPGEGCELIANFPVLNAFKQTA